MGQVKSRLRAPLLNSNFKQPLFQATYDADNRLATLNGQNITHDADGNMIQGSAGVPPAESSSGGLISPALINFTYNSRNQLTNADGLSYTYDAEGRCRSITDTTGTTRDVIDPSSKLLVRNHPNGTKTYYVYGMGLLYEVDAAENTKTYHFDQVGSTIARTDDTGKVIGTAEYSAYGLTAFSQGDMATPFLYNGQAGVQTDANGLLNMRARYYSPYLMRFLNAGPIGFSGGMNWFAYAGGDPISKMDPFGLREYGFGVTGTAAAVGGATGGVGFYGTDNPNASWADRFGLYVTVGGVIGVDIGVMVGPSIYGDGQFRGASTSVNISDGFVGCSISKSTDANSPASPFKDASEILQGAFFGSDGAGSNQHSKNVSGIAAGKAGINVGASISINRTGVLTLGDIGRGISNVFDSAWNSIFGAPASSVNTSPVRVNSYRGNSIK